MDAQTKKQFIQILTQAMAAYAKPLPEVGVIQAWISTLGAYPINVIAQAFTAYIEQNGEFAPIPAGIAKLCKLQDGRPGAEEAWAIALTSRDEADTVVWTADIAQAFAICRCVLDLGDKFGAHMAFKEAYNRIVAQARSANIPAQWIASIGFDVNRRAAVLQNPSNAALLSAPTIAALLPPPEATKTNDSNAVAQMAKIKQMLIDMNSEKQREIELHAQREREATAARKQELREQARGRDVY